MHFNEAAKAWTSVSMISTGSLETAGTSAEPNCLEYPDKEGEMVEEVREDAVRPRKRKRGTLDKDSKSWDAVQSRILRVLNYRYYESDVKALYKNPSFEPNDDSDSLACYDSESEMEYMFLQDTDDYRCKSMQTTDVATQNTQDYVVRGQAPTRQEPEVVQVFDAGARKWYRRTWSFLVQMVTLQKCRRKPQHREI